MKLNINVRVRVRLTATGRHLLREHYESLSLVMPEWHEDTFRLFEAELRELMQIFGPGLYAGASEVPFVDNEIEVLIP